MRQTDGADSSSGEDEKQTEKDEDDGVEAFVVRQRIEEYGWNRIFDMYC